MKRWLATRWILAALLLPSLVHAQQAPDSSRAEQPKSSPRFIDLNGDGINDLAPDRDGDGIPDDLDPMFRGQGNRARWGWYHSMPDSAMSDSVSFQRWWEGVERRPEWHRAWTRWQTMVNEAGGLELMRMRMSHEGMTPRDLRRMIIRERRRRGGGSGGGGGGRRGGGGRG